MKLRAVLFAALALVVALVATWALWPRDKVVPFWGEHQAGIAEPPQKFAFVAAFDVSATSPDGLRGLLKTWTAVASRLTQGQPLVGPDGPLAATADTGETLGYRPANLTVTFGAGPSLFDGRFGLADKRPPALEPLPEFAHDALQATWSGGDLVVQVCADDLETAYHALHNLTRAAKGLAVARWVQQGFQPGLEVNPSGPGRNLQGFIDGTVNPDTKDAKTMNEVVWAEGPQGVAGGSYLVVRRIRMFVEAWDRVSRQDQEQTIGRSKVSGDKLEAQPEDSHVKLAHGTGAERLLRRPFHFVSGLDARTGQFDSGLLFLAYMKDPGHQFVPMQSRLAASDALNEYIQTVGSALFYVFPGASPGSYVGAGLLPDVSPVQALQSLQSRLGALSLAASTGDGAAVAQGARDWLAHWAEVRSSLPSSAIDQAASTWAAAATASQPDASAIQRDQIALVRALASLEASITPRERADLGRLLSPLARAESALGSGAIEPARAAFGEFQTAWVTLEGEVRNQDGEAYTQLELLTGSVRRQLDAGQVAPAREGLRDLQARLAALKPSQPGSAWDVGLLLLREGLEALLVLAGLLAFVGRLGQRGLKAWVWTGAGAGLVLSVGVAAVVALLLQGWMAATTPELVEGLAGLAAVALMVGVGAWLHSKASVAGWTTWLKGQMNQPRRPAMWAALALVAVLREGAETVLFFWGLVGTLPWTDVVLGFLGAAVVLAVLGVVLIGGSRRLPLHLLFPATTALISVLAVKVLGQSLAALQTVGWLPQTSLGWGVPVGWLGFSPSWETALPQFVLAVVLAVLLVQTLVPKKAETASPSH